MSVQIPCGDLISPTSFMNNTHMKPDPAASDPIIHHQHVMSDVFIKQQPQPNGYGHNVQYIAPAGVDTAVSIKPDQEAWNQSNPAHTLPGFHVGSPSSPYPAAGVCSFGSDQVQVPADSAASHGSTDLGGMMPGMSQYADCQDQQSFGQQVAAGTTAAMQMQDMHPAALPAVGAGSPRANSGFRDYGFGKTDSASPDLGVNGRAMSKPGASSLMQHSHRASSSGQYAAGGRSSASVAAAAAAGDGQQVFRSQYRGVSYDKKKRKWRVQIKVAALGKSGARASRATRLYPASGIFCGKPSA